MAIDSGTEVRRYLSQVIGDSLVSVYVEDVSELSSTEETFSFN